MSMLDKPCAHIRPGVHSQRVNPRMKSTPGGNVEQTDASHEVRRALG